MVLGDRCRNGTAKRTCRGYSTYQWDDLAQFNIATGAPAGNAGLGSVLHAQNQVQTITTSLVWRFNWGGGVMSKY
jgi:hypothetical protein